VGATLHSDFEAILLIKTLGSFAISHIRDVKWNNKMMESLVMEPVQKEILYRLIKVHGSKSSGFDDFVKDKGKGLVGLLLGSPGLGKTLTAEAIAETANMPLFIMSSGSLGSSAREINLGLVRYLELATRWKTVLLLDEADVFLAKRNDNDLERNAIISVFLKELEYYPGILILTTNRARSIDPAFQSQSWYTVMSVDR
jgi:SpoVK/Ycf46/Vps4 family AAA+-type ATPase